jgi:hypothetical protein
VNPPPKPCRRSSLACFGRTARTTPRDSAAVDADQILPECPPSGLGALLCVERSRCASSTASWVAARRERNEFAVTRLAPVPWVRSTDLPLRPGAPPYTVRRSLSRIAKLETPTRDRRQRVGRARWQLVLPENASRRRPGGREVGSRLSRAAACKHLSSVIGAWGTCRSTRRGRARQLTRIRPPTLRAGGPGFVGRVLEMRHAAFEPPRQGRAGDRGHGRGTSRQWR